MITSPDATPTAPGVLRWYIPDTFDLIWVEMEPASGLIGLRRSEGGIGGEAPNSLDSVQLEAVTEAYRSARIIAADRRLWEVRD